MPLMAYSHQVMQDDFGVFDGVINLVGMVVRIVRNHRHDINKNQLDFKKRKISYCCSKVFKTPMKGNSDGMRLS